MYRFTVGDVAFLSSDDGTAALAVADDLPLDSGTLLADLTRLRRTAHDWTAAVVETVLLRRRAAARWRRVTADSGGGGLAPSRWLFTDDALQQASPPPVAAHRATRLAACAAVAGVAAVHDLTCSIGSDLVALTAAGTLAFGSDLDAVRLAMARHNLTAEGQTARLVRADACTVTSRHTLRYADPARRDASGRRISSTDTVPPVADLLAADPQHPPVLRLPPGIDYQGAGLTGEIEIVSLAGAVREAVWWPPAWATARRRATILTHGRPAEHLVDADPAEEEVSAARRYLIDPDPAVVRAHLVQQYAARYRLARLDPHLAYLTGDTPVPGVRSFEIVAAAPYSERTVRGWVARDGVGDLEIKQRGTPLIPDELRRRIRPRGDTRVRRTLIVARIGRGMQAFWCRDADASSEDPAGGASVGAPASAEESGA